jgi:hypothetical protein
VVGDDLPIRGFDGLSSHSRVILGPAEHGSSHHKLTHRIREWFVRQPRLNAAARLAETLVPPPMLAPRSGGAQSSRTVAPDHDALRAAGEIWNREAERNATETRPSELRWARCDQ